MAKLFGAEWEKLLRRILTNAFSSNLHFLPSDGQDHAFSAVPNHSLVLFRYPISVPIEVLNLARDASERMWPEIVAEHKGVIPTLEYFEGLFPIKVSCLKTHFLADILCRFIAVYNQVGSPDFTKESISKMIARSRVMEFIAITQQTCSWLLAHPDIVAALHGVIVTEHVDSLRKSEFASGPLRMAGSEDGKVLAIWNREYLSGTGSEAWGVFKLQGAHSLTAQLAISQQVFERTIYVINHRLQGLLLDGDLIHRPWANGSHTCLAGRGTEARQFSIAYFEGGPGYADLSSKAIFSIGPEHDFTKLQKAIDAELRNFAPAVLAANKIIDAQRRRPLLEAPALQDLRSAVLSGSDSSIASSVTVNTNFSSAFEAKAYQNSTLGLFTLGRKRSAE